jgi:hypothetical protein
MLHNFLLVWKPVLWPAFEGRRELFTCGHVLEEYATKEQGTV